MADDKTLDVVYLDVEIRKNGIENGLKQIGIEGKKSLHITQLAADDLNKAIKEAGDQVNITRRLFQAGAKDANTFETEMRQLDSAIKHLIETQELDTKQLLKLSGAARTAQASLDVYEGKITKLGLAHNVAIANSGKFNTQILNMVPGVSTLSGQLGIMSSAGLSAGAVLGGGLAIGAGLAAKSLSDFGKKAAEVADEIDKNAARTGTAIEEYQRLAYWADQNGISQDQLRQGLGDLNTRVGQAVAGNKTYAKSFEQLGVSLKDSRGNTRDTADILRDLVGRLSETENAAERTALAGAAFGEEFSRVVQPALEGGIDKFDEMRQRADELGLVLSEQSVKDLVAYKDSMAEVDKAVEFAKIQIGTAFLPVLENMADFTLNSVVPAMQEFAGWINSVTTNIGNATSAVSAFTTNPNLKNFVTAFNQLNPFTRGMPSENDLLNMIGQSEFSGGTMVGGGWGGKEKTTTPTNMFSGGGAAKVRTVTDEFKKYNEQVKLNNTLTTEAAQIDANLSSSKSFLNALLNPDIKGDRGGLVAQIESEIASLEGRKEAFKEQEQAAKDFQKSMEQLTGVYDKYNGSIAALQSDFARGNVSQSELDKQQLSIVQNTIQQLESFARAGLLTEYGQSFLQSLLDSEQVLKRILTPLTDAGVTSADRALAAAAPGNPFNQTVVLPTPKARDIKTAFDTYDYMFAEYQRDILGIGLIGPAFTPAALSLTDTLDKYDLAVAEYIRDSLGIGLTGGGFASTPLNKPLNLQASSLNANDLLSAEYLRDIIGEGLFGQDFKPLIQEKLKTTTERMLESLDETGLAAAEYIRDTVGLGLDSKNFTSAAPEIVSALDDVDLMLAEYIRDSIGVGITGGGFQPVENKPAPSSVPLEFIFGSSTTFTPQFDNSSQEAAIEAANQFASIVVSSASEFALDIGQAIKDGDFIQGLQGALGLGQNLAGAANLGTLPFLGGTIGIGSLVGTGLGLLSGIFGLFGGDNGQKERERLASQNRSLPNITFSNYITQNNQYTGTPQDAQVRNQYTDNAAELGDALFKNVLPRLAAIEKKVA